MLRADEIRGVYAIVPTPATAGADHWSATDTVDLVESARLVDRLILDGADAVIALGTTGECATITESEWHAFAEVVVTTAGGRVPTFIGATTMGTHETISRLRHLRDIGATGTLLGLPMWQPCTEDMAVRFYASVAEAVPELAVMVYMNARAFRFEFPLSFWARVVQEAPNVTSAKYTNAPPYAECVEATAGKVNFVPADMLVAKLAPTMPDVTTACWSTAASMGPQPAIALMRAIAARDWARMRAIDAEIVWANATFRPPDPVEFAVHNLQLEKLRMVSAGYCRPGPIRPPYDVVPEEYAERAYEVGRRWAELARKYGDVR